MIWLVVISQCALAHGMLVYTDARNIGVQGRAQFANAQTTFSDRASYYDRLPAEAKTNVREPVWQLSRSTAGMYVQFKTCSDELSLNLTYTSAYISTWNFPPSGMSGLDLYVWENSSSWRWIATTSNIVYPTSINTLAALQGGGASRYRLHLPLYNGLKELYIGHDAACPLKADHDEQRQVVWYGTSIAQGAVASRPGMAFTNAIALRLPYTILNFGFSSNCFMETSVGQYLVQIPDPALFVIDCLPNMEAAAVRSRTEPLVQFIRQHHPSVPIVLAEDATHGAAWLEPWAKWVQQQKRQALRSAYEALVGAGDTNLHYVYREQLWDFTSDIDKFMSPTLDRIHPSDLGMQAMADFYTRYLSSILATSQFKTHVGGMGLHRDNKVAEWNFDTSQSAASQTQSAGDWHWTDISEIGIMGQAFKDSPTRFNRLPARAKGLVNDLVWKSSLDSTGLFVAFETDATAITLRYGLASESSSLWQMPLSGSSGADLYRFDEATGVWGWVNCVDVFPVNRPHFSILSNQLPKRQFPSQYLLFLPLLEEVSWGLIGVDSGASSPRRNAVFAADGISVSGKKPIVWYGTSTAQVGAASRPGRTYTNILTRSLGRVVLSMGFAGDESTGVSELEFLSEIDAELLVIESSPAHANIELLVNLFRRRHPSTPIVLVERNDFSHSRSGNLNPPLQCEHEKLISQGYKGIHFVQSEHHEEFNPTVDGARLTDLGHWEIANAFTQYLQQLIGSSAGSLSSSNSHSDSICSTIGTTGTSSTGTGTSSSTGTSTATSTTSSISSISISISSTSSTSSRSSSRSKTSSTTTMTTSLVSATETTNTSTTTMTTSTTTGTITYTTPLPIQASENILLAGAAVGAIAAIVATVCVAIISLRCYRRHIGLPAKQKDGEAGKTSEEPVQLSGLPSSQLQDGETRKSEEIVQLSAMSIRLEDGEAEYREKPHQPSAMSLNFDDGAAEEPQSEDLIMIQLDMHIPKESAELYAMSAGEPGEPVLPYIVDRIDVAELSEMLEDELVARHIVDV